MESFITDVVSKLKAKDLNQSHFILPSRRAAQAFSKELFLSQHESFLAPPIQSIEEFIETVAEVKLISNLETIFLFYEVYQDLTHPNKQEPLDQVYNWGQSIVQDFNEIDRYQIDADQFFGNLKAIKDLEHWSKSDVKTDLVKNYIEFWESLPKYYHELKAKLKADKKAYQGMAYQEAASNIKDFINSNEAKFYFIGFNALNTCEETIFQYILEQQRGDVFWDIDNYLLTEHTAGIFMRSYSKTWPIYADTALKASTTSYSNKKTIGLYGVSKQIGQAKLVGDLLSEMTHEELDKTALILGDESLLQPLLNSLPKNISKVNVTMGLPLSSTNLASLFESLFKIRSLNQNELHYKILFELIEHPSLKKAYHKELQLIRKDLNTNNIVFQSKQDFFRKWNRLDDSLLNILKLSLNNTNSTVDEFLNTCLELIELLKPHFQDEKLSLEYLFGFKKLFIKLKNLLTKTELIKEFKVFHQIYQDTLSSETLDFEGSPYEGLQIMGMLETRVLDFENIIITSVNEGVLPSGKSQNSFIPFDLKKAYKLPTYKEKDAVYAYHFFRLVQRAKNCHFIFNNSTSGIEKAEKSRFITQLETFKLPQHFIKSYAVSANTNLNETSREVITKTPEMMTQLRTLFASGISPSALTAYIRNPIDFYNRYVLGLNEVEDIEEDISHKTLGTVIHDCLDLLYRKYVGKILKETDIEQMLNSYPKIMTLLFEERFQEESLRHGRNLIDFEIAKHQVKRFLTQEKKLVKANALKIIELEIKHESYFKVGGLDFNVKLRGTVDRVDLLNDQLRIIDYKTGKVEAKQLKIPKEWQGFSEDYSYSKAFQVLFYALLKEKDLGENAEAGIISFKNLNSGLMSCAVPKSNKNLKELVGEFKIELEALILEILNSEIPFTEKPV
ncbi:PD-(D/E)XK nuclease family protein [Psychroflexus sediminis]|uniref:PD-(D/E)XK nuclease superfamily protein n=1 Tax=Psychroflexus sediminis TaxID=470826 RepID=A0A1G7X7S3_9FLAO|nr:PD-(D/E)XK nuclease family protein [Psychroflexus sediminis]SDG80221.1 PD-(D/E)XK nuclease superfamily protein [Psychroflexus sediminis]